MVPGGITSDRKQRGRLEGFRAEIAEDFPDLSLETTEHGTLLRGSFPVRFGGRELGRFVVAIGLPHGFPDAEPVVGEIGGRIPHHPDRHVFPKTGLACVQAPGQWLALPAEERTLGNFLRGPLHNYLLGQLAVEAGLDWPFGEYTHGYAGLLEAYSDMLGLEADRPSKVEDYLEILERGRVKGHWECPCGSGKIIRNCHTDELRDLQAKVTPEAAATALRWLRLYRPREAQEAST